MAVSRMLKMQLVAHASIKDEVKAFLREAGVVEVTDVSVDGFHGAADENETGRYARLIEQTDTAIEFLAPYVPRPGYLERMAGGPAEVSVSDIEKTLAAVDVEAISRRCGELEGTLRRCRDELAWSAILARELEPWLPLETPFEALSTEAYRVQFWTLPEKISAAALDLLNEEHPFSHVEPVAAGGGFMRAAIIVPRKEMESAAEHLKQAGCIRGAFEDLKGTPAAVIEREKGRRAGLEAEIEKAETEARALAEANPALLALSDHFREKRGLSDVERHFHRTERTFVIEGWIREVHRRRLEKDLSKRWSEVELVTRPPLEGEDPPIHLANRSAAQPFEFIMTLYGRPLYGEVDPTPLLAPFFIVCFALCMSDAGYGLVLAALCALFLFKFRIRGGMRQLFQVLLIGSLITVIVGIITGGYFGADMKVLPDALTRFILINPLEEPMKMLNVAFLIGIVHILFGIGVRMVVNFRAHLWLDAIFDDLGWILFLIVLAPLGFAYILGGSAPPAVLSFCSRAALVIAAVLFVTGARKEKNKLVGVFKSLIKFYSITGYFSDVLSYARLLALGLASAAIAVAINGIAQMVKGLPFYTGYLAAVAVLVLGHTFNLAVNVLGAFVHSARLQYLEFFGKFFSGGGREFRPFRSERRYTILKETEIKT